MRYHNITHDDMKNGTGLRVVLWVAGCEHHCAECQNPVTWDADGGLEFTPWEESEFFEWLSKPWTEGATFSGGDPLHPKNRSAIGALCKKIKKEYPGKTIWLYTGYELKKEEIFVFANANGDTFELPWLHLVDVLVDGRFETEIRKKDIKCNHTLHWKGSSNQRVIDVQKSLNADNICLLKGERTCITHHKKP